MISTILMNNGRNNYAFVIADDGSARDVSTGKRYDDFATLFMLLRNAGYSMTGEVETATERRRVQQARISYKYDTDPRAEYRHDWFRMADEAYAADNWVAY